MYKETEEERELRRKKILNELNTFIISNISYTKYLETLGNINDLDSFCNVEKLQVIYASFMMMLWKDEYIKKDKSRLISTLSDELLDDIVSIVAEQRNDNSWKIGDLIFENNYDVIDVIKNKLAHGDYIINENYLELDIDKKKGYILIDNLVDFTNELAVKWEKIKSKGENIQNFVTVKIPSKDLKGKINNFKDVNKYLKYLGYLELSDKPYPGYERNREYTETIEEFTSSLISNMNGKNPNYIDVLKMYLLSMQKLGIDLNIKSTPANMLPNYEKVLECFRKNKTFYREENLEKQINYLAYTLYEKNNNIAPKKNITEGIISNQKFLIELAKDNQTSLVDLLNAKDKVSLPEKSKLDKSILTSYLVGFYVVYIYGLDEIYTADERDHIDKIYNHKMFDFSKLDLSSIKPNILSIDKDFSCFNAQLNKNIQTNKINLDKYYKLRRDAISIRKKIDEYKNSPEKDLSKLKNALKKQNEMISKALYEYSANKMKIHFEEEFIKNDFEKYKENRSIIEHIRNSISHGNVKINYIGGYGSREDSTIYFQDRDNERITFEAELSTKEFTTLITGKNIKEVCGYLDTNTQNYNKEIMNEEKEINIIPKQKYKRL